MFVLSIPEFIKMVIPKFIEILNKYFKNKIVGHELILASSA